MESYANFIVLVWSTLYLCATGARRICFKPYGCFFSEKSFESHYAVLPDPPSKIQTKFYLYTRLNRDTPELLNINDASSIKDSQFNPSKKTIIIVHGYSHHSKKPWVIKMKNELLDRGSFNVVNVDWQKGAAFDLFYIKAVANARLVGAQIAQLIMTLNNVTGISPRCFHIVGHSLGAHIAGDAGRRLAEKNLTLFRITGLDPARPQFEGSDISVRLDKTDAEFVDVIHSNSAPFLFGGVGYRGRLGHVDFYPNGGEYQPGCDNFLTTIWRKGVLNAATCNHMRSVEYFIKSIRKKCQFIAFPCRSWQAFKKAKCFKNMQSTDLSVMGYNAGAFRDRTGSMYLITGPKHPFCVYNYLVTISFSGSRSTYNDVYVKIIGSERETKLEKINLAEGSGESVSLITTHRGIGAIRSIELVYYGFNSFYIGRIRARIIHKCRTYTACFDQTLTNEFWAFWTRSWARHKRKAYAGEDCYSNVANSHCHRKKHFVN